MEKNKKQQKPKQVLPFVEFSIDPSGIDSASDPQDSYRLTFDYNEICDAEVVTGLNLLWALRNLDATSAGQMRGLVYALLKSAHPEVLLSEAGALLAADSASVINAVRKVLKVKTADEAVLESLARIAAENPQALVDMLREAGIDFEIRADEAPASDAAFSDAAATAQ